MTKDDERKTKDEFFNYGKYGGTMTKDEETMMKDEGTMMKDEER